MESGFIFKIFGINNNWKNTARVLRDRAAHLGLRERAAHLGLRERVHILVYVGKCTSQFA